MSLSITVMFIKEPEGYFSVKVPGLQGCFTDGDTLEDAMKNAEQVIYLYLETLKKEGLPIPENEHIRNIPNEEDESLSEESSAPVEENKLIGFEIRRPIEADASISFS